MRKKLKQALCLGLALLTLAACGGPGAGGDDTTTDSGTMGRYVEQAVAQLGSAQVLSGLIVGDSPAYYLARRQDENIQVYKALVAADGQPGAESEVPWLSALCAEGYYPRSISQAADGTVYALLADQERGYYLYRCPEGGQLESIPMEEWQPKSDGANGGIAGQDADMGTLGILSGVSVNDGSFIMPAGICALDDGGFLVSYSYDGAARYDSAGKKIQTYAGMAYTNGWAVYGSRLAMLDEAMESIVVYDLDSGKVVDTHSADGLSYDTVVGMDAEGVMLGDNAGIRRLRDRQWKLAVDGGLTSLILPTMVMGSLSAGPDGDFYAFLGSEETQLVRFYYDESIPARPDTLLEVFSLYDSNTIRQAIGEFQRRNPNVQVKLRVALGEDSSATVEDVIRALNTELIAGKGPDLIVLDGLPVASYVEKGVLADLSELVTRMEAQGLMANLAGAYSKDSGIYGLPARFAVPVMIGKQDVLTAADSLAALARLVREAQGGDVPLLRAPESFMDGRSTLKEYYDTNADSFTDESGAIDQAALAAFLAAIRELDAVFEEIVAPLDAMVASYAVAMGGVGGYEVLDLGSWDLREGKADAHIQTLGGIMGLRSIGADLGGIDGMGMASLFGQNKFLPKCSVGVVAEGQSELALSFVELLVSTTVQDQYLYDGLPVNGLSLEKTVEDFLGDNSGMGEAVPDMGFLELCKTLDTPVFIDQVVKEAVMAQLPGLMDGTLTPEQAAAAAVDKTRLYLAE